MANELGIFNKDYRSLQTLAGAEGYDDITEMLQISVMDSVVPGICTECNGTQDCEPDARNNYCEECGTQTVRSYLDLAGVI